MPEQLPLRYNDDYRMAQLADQLLDLCRDVVNVRGLKQVAFDLDVQPSALAHAIAERERHYPRLRWLPYLVVHAPDDKIPELIASWRKLECKRVVELTDRERVERYERALEEMGPELAKVVRERAGLA